MLLINNISRCMGISTTEVCAGPGERAAKQLNVLYLFASGRE